MLQEKNSCLNSDITEGMFFEGKELSVGAREITQKTRDQYQAPCWVRLTISVNSSSRGYKIYMSQKQ